jgi:hypothetical protein
MRPITEAVVIPGCARSIALICRRSRCSMCPASLGPGVSSPRSQCFLCGHETAIPSMILQCALSNYDDFSSTDRKKDSGKSSNPHLLLHFLDSRNSYRIHKQVQSISAQHNATFNPLHDSNPQEISILRTPRSMLPPFSPNFSSVVSLHLPHRQSSHMKQDRNPHLVDQTTYKPPFAFFFCALTGTCFPHGINI